MRILAVLLSVVVVIAVAAVATMVQPFTGRSPTWPGPRADRARLLFQRGARIRGERGARAGGEGSASDDLAGDARLLRPAAAVSLRRAEALLSGLRRLHRGGGPAAGRGAGAGGEARHPRQ